MTTETIEYVWDGDKGGGLEALEAQIEKLAKSIDNLGGDLDKTDEQFDETGKSASKLDSTFNALRSGGIKGVQLGIQGITAVGLGAIGVLGGLTKGALDFSEAGSDQEKVFNRLSSSINGVVSDASEAEKTFLLLQERIAEQTADTDFGDEEISDALSTYIDVAGDAVVTTDRLSTILGVMEQKQKGAEDAAKLVAKAHRGDVDALAELTPVTKEQIAALNGIKDAQERGAKASEILEARYKGQASTLGTARASIKEASDATGDLQQMVGRLLNQSGLLPAIIDPGVGALRDMEGWLAANSVRAQELAISAGNILAAGLEVGIEAAIFGYKAYKDLELGLSFAAAGLKVIPDLAEIVGRSLLVLGADVIGAVLEKLSDFGESAADIARAVGADGIANALDEATASADSFSSKVDGFATEQLKGIADETRQIDTTVKELNDDVGDWVEGYRDAEKAGDKARAVTDAMRDGLAKASANIKPLTSGYEKSAAASADTAKSLAEQNKLLKEQKGLTDEEFFLSAQRLDLEYDILQARQRGDEQGAIELEHELAVLAVEEAKLAQKEEGLRAQVERNGLLEAQLAKEEALKALEDEAEKERLEKIKERNDELKKQQEDRKKKLEEEAEEWRTLGDDIGAAISQLGGTDSEIARITAALGGMSDALVTAAGDYQYMVASGTKAQDALASSAGTATGAIGDAVASQIDDTGKASLVRAGFAAAEVALHLASGNVASAGLAGIGLVGHTATAALAGKSGGASASGGGGGAGRGAAPTSVARGEFDPERLAEIQGRTFAEAIGQQGQGGGQTIVFDLSNNTNLMDSPSMERMLTDVVRNGLSAQGIDLVRRN